jgi:hypothetical protein
MKTAKIQYDTLQSKSGVILIDGKEIRFAHIETSGNNLILYDSGNSEWEGRGRIIRTVNLLEYTII